MTRRPLRLLPLLLCSALLVAALPRPAEAQIWKKMKKRVEEEIDERTTKAEARIESEFDEAVEGTADRTEALIENAVNCAFDDPACVEAAEKEGRTVVLTDKEGNALKDENGDPILAGAPPPPPPGTPQRQSAQSACSSEGTQVFMVVEQQPELIGGMATLQARMRYPSEARAAGAEGRVFVQFILDLNGKVTQATILRSPHSTLNAEALRLIETAAFRPGKQRGTPVCVKMSLPVTFALR